MPMFHTLDQRRSCNRKREKLHGVAGAHERLNKGAINGRGGRDPECSIGRGHDLFATALLAQSDRDLHRDRTFVSTESRRARFDDGRFCWLVMQPPHAGPRRRGDRCKVMSGYRPEGGVNAGLADVNPLDQRLDDPSLY